MVKVIGEAPELMKQAKCRHCAAMLEYTSSDVKRHDEKDYSGGPAGYEWIDCPRCSKEVVLQSW